jgi:uncharacterized surface protein with fasciclin (FAS1) repeats
MLRTLVVAGALALAPALAAAQETKDRAESDAAAQTIAERLAQDPRFSELTRSVTSAGLAKLLDAKGPYTVFAPVNEAFENSEEAEGVSDDPQALGDLLRRHVVVGPVERTDRTESEVMVETLAGEEIAVDFGTDPITVGEDAKVVEGGIAASNGTIHAIDSVLVARRD